MIHKLAFLGFGGVGQGLAEILLNKQKMLQDQFGFHPRVVAITDPQKGAIYHPDGLDLSKILTLVKETGRVDTYPDELGLVKGWDSFETIQYTNADTIVEVTYTNVETGQPGIDHCRKAFENGKNVVTTNKGPLALAYRELTALADQKGVYWGYEGTVMSGTPALRMPLSCLAGNEMNEICGILNGTTNYILTKMEDGISYEEALKEAQQHGYAEADPTSDVKGYDALYKTVILANVIMNVPLDKKDVKCQGIDGLTQEDIIQAKEEGKRWKLLARIQKTKEGVQASVQPEKLSLSDPLAGVGGAVNAITFTCDLSGAITLVGAGAGIIETGYALLIDLLHIDSNMKQKGVSDTNENKGS